MRDTAVYKGAGWGCRGNPFRVYPHCGELSNVSPEGTIIYDLQGFRYL